MAFQILTPFLGTAQANANYSSATNLNRLVELTTAGKVVLATAATKMPLGVLMNTPNSSEAARVQVTGIAPVRFLSTATHSAIVPGSKICASTAGNGSGQLSTLLTRPVFGRSLDALAANTSGIISVLITHEGAGSSGAGTVG